MYTTKEGNTLHLHGDYRYENFKISDATSTIIDASDASWIVSNMGSNVNRYPVAVQNSPDVKLLGGTISGEVSLSLDWTKAYVNSAALLVRDSDNVLVQDWNVTQAWDGIRFRGDDVDNFTVDRVWLSDVRDDGIENDDGLSGTISNSFFDGVMGAISNAEPNMGDQSGEVVTLDNVLIRMESYLYKGRDTHMSPFKVYDTSPRLQFYDTVIAIEDVNHHGRDSLVRAWEKTIDASGSYLLNLSDEPLPQYYPLPPEGFTVLQGKEARTFWEAARSNWIAEFNGESTAPETPPVVSPAADDAEVPGGSASEKVTSSISASSDDWEQNGGAESKVLELGLKGSTSQVVGLRFTGLDIPQGAEIESAHIIFEAYKSKAGAASLTIAVEDADAATSYTAGSQPNTRSYMEDTLVWTDVESWADGNSYQTADLSELIQAVVDKHGATDTVGFKVTGSGSRTAESFDGPGEAPMLVVTYVEDDTIA